LASLSRRAAHLTQNALAARIALIGGFQRVAGAWGKSFSPKGKTSLPAKKVRGHCIFDLHFYAPEVTSVRRVTREDAGFAVMASA